MKALSKHLSLALILLGLAVCSQRESASLRSAMVNHLNGVMKHCQAKVIAWEVVNEAWSPDDPTQLRDSVCNKKLAYTGVMDALLGR